MLKTITYTSAVALALFSGSVSTVGLMKFAPGAEWVIAILGLLFEAGKLTAFALMHHKLSRAHKASLLVIGTVLMTLNIIGVSGFLSNHFEREQIAARATSHTAETEAKAAVSTLERQLASAEAGVSKAQESMGKARGDRDQIKAVKSVITQSIGQRDQIARELAAAQVKQAKVEGQTIEAGGEVAAIMFLAELTGSDLSTVAHRVFLAVACLPELLAVLLLLAAEMIGKVPAVQAQPAPVVVPVQVSKKTPRTKAQRSKSAKDGWETRRRNLAKKTGPQLVAARS